MSHTKNDDRTGNLLVIILAILCFGYLKVALVFCGQFLVRPLPTMIVGAPVILLYGSAYFYPSFFFADNMEAGEVFFMKMALFIAGSIFGFSYSKVLETVPETVERSEIDFYRSIGAMGRVLNVIVSLVPFAALWAIFAVSSGSLWFWAGLAQSISEDALFWQILSWLFVGMLFLAPFAGLYHRLGKMNKPDIVLNDDGTTYHGPDLV